MFKQLTKTRSASSRLQQRAVGVRLCTNPLFKQQRLVSKKSYHTICSTQTHQTKAHQQQQDMSTSEKQQKTHKMPQWHQPNGRRSGIKIFNSLTHKDDEFITSSPDTNVVNWYTCGPTVYDKSHMGHARSYVAFDILRRIMEDYFNYDVNYVINVTDIDDKIIKKANREALQKVVENISTKLANTSNEQVAVASFLQDVKQKLHEDFLTKNKNLQLTMRQIYDLRIQLVKLAEEAGFSGVDVEPDFVGIARFYERLFWKDLKDLQCRAPSTIVRVTEFVPEIVDFIQRIIDNGFAYESQGSVYFDVDAFKTARGKDGHVVASDANEEDLYNFVYGKLEPWSVEDAEKLQDGEGEWAADDTQVGKQIVKRSPRDFALWKKSIPGEPSWPSQWSQGRPGWHIECSAMASYAFNYAPNIDIHCGGVDLRFPHHDNELAQSEAHFCCKQWVNYFMHAGHLSIEGLTMSKSKKNFLTIADQLQYYNSRQIRMLFLLHKFSAPMDYSEETMTHAIDAERTFNEYFGNIKSILREEKHTDFERFYQEEFDLFNLLQEKKKAVHEALCDSFNTPRAMKHLIALRDASNKYLQDKANQTGERGPKLTVLRQIAAYITSMFRVFGLVDSDGIGFSVNDSASSFEEQVTPFLNAMSQFRDDIRAISREAMTNKDKEKKDVTLAILKKCDQIRDDVLPTLGVRLEDLSDRSRWKLEDVKTLMIERQRKLEAEQEKIISKLKLLTDHAKKARDTYEKSLKDPSTLFQDAELYSEWDEKGIPTKLKDGTPITKSAAKTLVKTYNAQEKIFKNEEQKKKFNDDMIARETALLKFKEQNNLE